MVYGENYGNPGKQLRASEMAARLKRGMVFISEGMAPQLLAALPPDDRISAMRYQRSREQLPNERRAKRRKTLSRNRLFSYRWCVTSRAA